MPLLQTIALALGVCSLTAAAANGIATPAGPQPYVNYSAVTGYFLQDAPATDPSTFDYVR